MTTTAKWAIGGLAAALVALWLLSQLLPSWLSPVPQSSTSHAPPATQAGQPGDARRIHASLFYVADSGDALVAVDSEVPYAAAPATQARRIVEAQLAAPPSGRTSAIPSGAAVRALFLTSRGEAFVDISAPLATNHPGGSLFEALTVYTIVNALTVNLPDITSVQILIEGREVETLAGHIDLRHPLTRGSRWIQQPPPQ